ncbi:LCP family protein [Thermomonospora umbrina]|nr:LCP family protein [Thermomonospora umbrina]
MTEERRNRGVEAPTERIPPQAGDHDTLGGRHGRGYDHGAFGYDESVARGSAEGPDDGHGQDPYDDGQGHRQGPPGRPPSRGAVPPGGRTSRRAAGPRRRRWPRVTGILVALMLLFVVGGYFFLDSRLQREDVLGDYEGRPADTPGTNWLVVGSDSREGLSKKQRKEYATGGGSGRRTDSMMLVHYGDGGTTLLSLPRDSYVPIPGRGSNKLNAAFAYGGPKLLVRTVEKATGIRVDHYAEIGFGGFVGVVDAIGGVDLCVKEPLKDPKAGLDLKEGCQTLSGGEALGYVRTRKFANGDLQRVEHQRQFFAALMDKASGPGVLFNPFRSIPLAMNSTSNFTVDENDHLHDLARLMWAMRSIGGGDGVTTTVPVGGFGSSAAAGSYVRWDTAKSSALFEALREDRAIPSDLIKR